MRWLCTARLARTVAASLSVVALAGCPELNHWSGPTQDPFFSIADPLPRAQISGDCWPELDEETAEHPQTEELSDQAHHGL